VPGTPVKLLWTREEDMTHGRYHPVMQAKMTGALDASGNLMGLHIRLSGQSILASVFPQNLQDGRDNATFQGLDPSGDFAFGYSVPNLLIDHAMRNTHVPPGFWRGVNINQNAIFVECFMDELAHAAGKDPLQFRLDLLSGPLVEAAPNPAAGGRGGGAPGWDPARMRAVIELVRDKSGWGKTNLPKGTAMGVAFHFSHAGYFAEVAQVAVDANKKVRVDKIWVAADIGRQIVNPLNSEAQVQSAVIDGMSQLMGWEVTIKNGAAVEGNFDEYQPVRMRNAPKEINVHFLQTDNNPTGLGEPALPPILPAIANAIFTVTGDRVRTLPLFKSGYQWA